MNMLDPTAIANPKDYAQEDFRDKGLVIRRFKKDVREQLKQSFPERQIDTVRTPASMVEEAAYERLSEAKFRTLDGRGAGQLFRTVLEKALFSSPAACLSTIENRLKRLQPRARDDDILADIATLEGLRSVIQAIKPSTFSKYKRLVELLRPGSASSLGWNPRQPDDRLVIFTESLVTLDFLRHHLPVDLKLPPDQILSLRGDMRDRDLMETVEQFNKLDSPARLLLCSDVAAEGINLHHLSHRMIHFDIPWSLMVFQQRNGRIDRYGQMRQPQIRYLLTESDHSRVRGDLRVLEILIEKDSQAGKNIGDPSEFMGKFNPQEEEAITAAVIEQDKKDDDDISDIFATLLHGDTEASDLLAQFTPASPPSAEFESVLGKSPRLYGNDMDYAAESLRWLRENGAELQADIESDLLRLTAPNDLAQRLRYLPSEIRPNNDRFVLTCNKPRIYAELKRCREEDSPWPEVQYLWPLHPVMEWLADRALNAFGRHTAPVLRLATLASDEHVFLMYGGFPNRRGHILVHAWLAVTFRGETVQNMSSLDELFHRLALKPGQLANRGIVGDTSALQALLPLAIPPVKQALKRLQTTKQDELTVSLLTQHDALQAIKGRHYEQLEIDFQGSDQPEAFKRARREERTAHIDRIFKDHLHWLENTQTMESDPFIQVAAVFTGRPA